MNKIIAIVVFLCACVPVVAVAPTINLADMYAQTARDNTFGNPVVIAGDSLVHRMEWNYLFRDVLGADTPTVFNRGIGGDTSGMLKARYSSNVLALNPSKVFILIGTNDFHPSKVTAANYQQLADGAFNNIQAIVNMTDVPVYVISVLPFVEGTLKNTAIDYLNSRLATIEGATYIDANSHMNEIHLLSDNSAHITDEGYRVLGSVLLEYL